MHKQFKNLMMILILLIIGIDGVALENKQILLLNSYHKGFTWTDEITNGVSDAILDNNIDLHVEYLDTKKQWDENYILKLTELFTLKFKKNNYDLIITSDDNAFNFAVKNRESLFPETPIIFCGLNFLESDQLSNMSNITGINENIDIEGNINLIKKLHVNLEKIIVITDNSTTGKKIQKKVMQTITKFPNTEIDLVYDITKNGLINLVQNSSDETYFLYTIFFNDKNGDYYENMISKIYTKSKTPIYGAWNFNLNEGIVGGILIDGFTQGNLAGLYAKMLFSGIKISDIPIEYNTPTKTSFDYRIIKRFKMDLSSIKWDILINKPESFYQNNKLLIWSVSIVIFILLILLFSVTFFLIKSKKATSRLENYKMNLENIVSARTSELTWSLKTLEETQKKLIETQKFAYVGSLVSGVAHELNTPLSVGIMSISHQLESIQNLDKNISENTLQKRNLDRYITMSKESLTSSLSSLQSAADIIKKFNQISITQLTDSKQTINFHNFMTELIENVYSKQFGENFKIILFCDENIVFDSYPDLIITIFDNLITNSSIHSFKYSNSGIINIIVTKTKNGIEIVYKDSGECIYQEDIENIFNPFYTTKRDSGHLGLGLNIVHNIIYNKLDGSISCERDRDEKTYFVINI